MNRFIFIVIFLTSSLYSLTFHSYEDALELQKKSGKIIMLDVMRSDCHYCSKMQEEVFNNKEMSVWLSKRFISVEMNLDFDELPSGLVVYVTPSFFFMDKSRKVIKKIVGAWSIQDFKDLTKNIK